MERINILFDTFENIAAVQRGSVVTIYRKYDPHMSSSNPSYIAYYDNSGSHGLSQNMVSYANNEYVFHYGNCHIVSRKIGSSLDDYLEHYIIDEPIATITLPDVPATTQDLAFHPMMEQYL